MSAEEGARKGRGRKKTPRLRDRPENRGVGLFQRLEQPGEAAGIEERNVTFCG